MATSVTPEISHQDTDTGTGGSVVIVYDNDHNTPEEVVDILQRATGCSLEEAQIEMWEVHNLGKSVVHHGSAEECDRVASVIRTIGIVVEVRAD